MTQKKHSLSFKLVVISLCIIAALIIAFLFRYIFSLPQNDADSVSVSEQVSVLDYSDGFLIGSDLSNKTGEFGSFRNDNGEQYIGSLKSGVPEGEGKYLYSNGAEYIGDFKNGVRSGRGSLSFPDGTTFTGSWENDSLNGDGKLEYPDGLSYEGIFEDGVFISGIVCFTSNNDRYELNFKDGEYNGTGIVTYSNGDTYLGELSIKQLLTFGVGNNSGFVMQIMRNGFGEYRWNSGHYQYYEGQWVDNTMSGNGKLYLNENKEWIEGVFKNNKPISITYHSTSNYSLNNVSLSWVDANGGM